MNAYKVSEHLERMEEGDEIYFFNHANGSVMELSLGMIGVLEFLQQARSHEELIAFVKKQEQLEGKEKTAEELRVIVSSIEELLITYELATLVEIQESSEGL